MCGAGAVLCAVSCTVCCTVSCTVCCTVCCTHTLTHPHSPSLTLTHSHSLSLTLTQALFSLRLSLNGLRAAYSLRERDRQRYREREREGYRERDGGRGPEYESSIENSPFTFSSLSSKPPLVAVPDPAACGNYNTGNTTKHPLLPY